MMFKALRAIKHHPLTNSTNNCNHKGVHSVKKSTKNATTI